MRITESQLRRIINEALLNEEVFGAQAFVYHGSRTPPEKFASIIERDTFDPGGAGGGKYGKGLYTVYEADESSNTFTGAYGEHVYKLKVSLSGFLICDLEVAQKVFGKWVSISDQLKKMGLGSVAAQLRKTLGPERVQKIDAEPELFSDGAAHAIFPVVSARVKGLVFSGRRDGKAAVVYDPSSVVLLAHKTAGEGEWQKIDPSRASLARSAAGAFTPSRHNFPMGSSEKTAQRIRAAVEEAGLPWDDYHEERIKDAKEGLDKMSASNLAAWKRAVERHVKKTAEDAEGEMPDDEIEERTQKAIELALKGVK